jgi:glycyl-tRNA synthetase (class II)
MNESQRRRNKELKAGNVYMLGKNHSAETKEKMRAARVKYFQDPKNREKHKLTQRNKKFSPSFSSKMSDIRSQMKWITNGEKNKQIKKIENIPVGWRPGRVLKK